MLSAGPGDTIQLEAGYGNETATVTHNGMVVTGGALSTGIVLQLGTGIATFSAGGTAPFTILDSPGANGIVGNAGNNLITVSGGADAVDGGLGIDRLTVDYRLATGAVTGNSLSNFTEAGGGARSVTVTAGTIEHFTVLTGSGADTITTGAGDDIIDVGAGANTVTAGEGDNRITGGGDADTVTAGGGNDIIDVGGGTNTVQAGQGANTITGGSGADSLTALDGGNFIDGGDGANILTSGAGNDIILSGNGSATIVAGAGQDLITVKAGAAGVDAGPGDDRLTIDFSALTTSVAGGVTGGSLVAGYTGHVADIAVSSVDFVFTENFTIVTGSANDTLTTGDGIDALAGGAGDDQLFSGGGSDQLFGGAGNDLLNGGAGDDAIYGGSGNDTMLGGTGQDGFVVDELFDVIVENIGEGTDTAFVSVSGWTNFAGVEIVRLMGTANLLYGSAGAEDLVANGGMASTIDAMGGNDVVWGSAFNDVLNGNFGDDIIRGQGGADQMYGGAGNDQFVVFDAASQVHENAGEGYDVVYFVGAGSFDIGAHVEEARLSASGTGLIGNAADNLLVGNNGGLASTVNGGGGNDTLYGTAAADTLTGGAGNDTFYSQGGADIFRFDAPGWGVDQIAGYTAGAHLQFTAGSGVTDFSQLNLNVANGNTQVNHGADIILVFGAVLTQSDFLFG